MKTRMLRGDQMGGIAISAMLVLCCFVLAPLTRGEGGGSYSSDVTPVVQAPAVVAPSGDANPPPAKASAAPTQQVEPVLPKLSPAVAEVVKLAQSKVSDEVLLAFVERTNHVFSITAEEIIYLHDIGVSEAVITVLIKRSQVAPLVPGASAEPVLPQVGIPPSEGAPAPAIAAPSSAAVPALMAEAPQQVAYFYPSLAPYGTWLEVPDYGWCWRPTVAVIDTAWRPYCHRGRWLDTDSGWYWQSDYSWGWAPFHYGRWYYHRHNGWVWVPGSTWAPAWVSWRQSPSHCGWAPLPPEAHYGIAGFSYYGFHVSAGFEFGLTHHYYTYLPIERFCAARPYSHFLWGTHATAIHNQCRVMNNYYVGRNTIMNPGPLTGEQVARVSRSEVRKVSVLDLPSDGGRRVRPDRLMPAGESLAIYRPTLRSPLFSTQPQPPSRQEQELRKNTAAGAGGGGIVVNKGTAVRAKSVNAPAINPALSPMQPAPKPGVETLAAPQAITSASTPPKPAVENLRPPQPVAPMQPAIRPGLEVTRAPQPVTSVPTPPRAGIDPLAAPSPMSPMQPAVRPGLEVPRPMNPAGSQPSATQFGASERAYVPRPMYNPQPMSLPNYPRSSPRVEPPKTTPYSPYQRSPSSFSASQPQTSRPSFVNPSVPTTSRRTTTDLQPRPRFTSPSPAPSRSPSSSFSRPSFQSAPAPQRPAISAPSPAPTPRVAAPSYSPASRPSPSATRTDRPGGSRQEIRK